MPLICETVVFCHLNKRFRILNLHTGILYRDEYDNQGDAEAAIEDGKVRNGYLVKRVSLNNITSVLPQTTETLDYHRFSLDTR